MRNRAKCNLCKSLVEIKNRAEEVSCPCGEITIDRISGVFHAVIKNDKSNLIMLDEEGNEIVPKEAKPESAFPGIDEPIANQSNQMITHKKEDLIDMLDDLRMNIERLPNEAKFAPITNYDLSLVLTTLVSIFRSDCN